MRYKELYRDWQANRPAQPKCVWVSALRSYVANNGQSSLTVQHEVTATTPVHPVELLFDPRKVDSTLTQGYSLAATVAGRYRVA